MKRKLIEFLMQAGAPSTVAAQIYADIEQNPQAFAEMVEQLYVENKWERGTAATRQAGGH